MKLPEIITEQELVDILKVTKKPEHRAAFVFGFYGAMRVSEIVKLKREDIDTVLKLVWIKQSKGHKDRKIPLSPEMSKYVKFMPVGCGRRALQFAFKGKAKKALKRDLHIHILRHSGITYYITIRKWSTLEVQRLAGHSKSTITEIYTHIAPLDLVEKSWNKEVL